MIDIGKRGPIQAEEILDYQIKDRHIVTGELRATKIPDLELPTRVYADFSIIDTKVATGELRATKIPDLELPTRVYGDFTVTDVKVATGELRATKIPDLELPTRVYADFSVTDVKVPTGEMTFKRFKSEAGTSASTPDADTEIAHGLGITPTEVTLVPKTTAVLGYTMLTTKSATSITIRASVSGVDVDYSLVV